MIVTKGIGLIPLIKRTGIHIIWLLVLFSTIAILYRVDLIGFRIPWLPISVIGTAVAFYVGFKNNQSYDRMWEARKIWGGIVNNSRTFGMYIDGYVNNEYASKALSEEELHAIKQRIFYRHIAWLYSLRSQLLLPTEWEHISQEGQMARYAKFLIKRFGVGLLNDDVTNIELSKLLPKDEYERLINYRNTATQIINEQSRDLKKLKTQGLVNDFRQVEIMKILKYFYDEQGKAERIKKFPLPRQYANMSRYFTGIFILLLPFSMIPELMNVGDWGFYMSIPITALIGWVYVMMEVVGDYSENPFQNMSYDIPMLSLCRTIEIDMREMLGETDLPDTIKAVKGVLM